jgi:hypothetical protein
VKIFPAPVEFIFQTGFGIKINIAIVGIDDVLFLARIQRKSAPGFPVFRFIYNSFIWLSGVNYFMAASLFLNALTNLFLRKNAHQSNMVR